MRIFRPIRNHFGVFPALMLLVLIPQAEASGVFVTPTNQYVNSTTLVTFADPDEALIGSITDGFQTITFTSVTSLMRASTVGDDWSTWGAPPSTESSTPRVLWSGLDDNFDSVTAVTFTLSQPALIFGFEAEPGFLDTHTMVATFFMGGTVEQTISLDVVGNAGAVLFAAQAPSGIFFDSVTLTSDVDWAAGQFRYEVIPEPQSFGLVSAGLIALLFISRKTRGIQ